jgi:transposase-like protein
MVCDLLFYEILLFALLGLGVTLYGVWQRSQPAPGQAKRKPSRQAKQHAKDKQPFAGLTTKPHCEACEHAREPADPPPPAPPPLLAAKRGRPRELNTHTQYCPTKTCPYYGWTGRGNIRANGHPGGGPWRQFHCSVCKTYFLETHGTLFYGQALPADWIVRVVAALAEGLGLRAVARVFDLDPNTVLAWCREAAAQLHAFSRFLLHEVQVRQIQLDELFAVLSQGTADQGSDAEASAHFPRSPHWVWVAIDPESKLLLALDSGQRTLAMAQRLVHHVVQLLVPGWVPLFLTDGFKEYATALLTHFGHWVQPLRRQAKGPAPKPRWLPRPELLYAQVVKQYRRRRLGFCRKLYEPYCILK